MNRPQIGGVPSVLQILVKQTAQPAYLLCNILRPHSRTSSPLACLVANHSILPERLLTGQTLSILSRLVARARSAPTTLGKSIVVHEFDCRRLLSACSMRGPEKSNAAPDTAAQPTALCRKAVTRLQQPFVSYRRLASLPRKMTITATVKQDFRRRV